MNIPLSKFPGVLGIPRMLSKSEKQVWWSGVAEWGVCICIYIHIHKERIHKTKCKIINFMSRTTLYELIINRSKFVIFECVSKIQIVKWNRKNERN